MRLTVAKTDVPVGAVADKDRSALKDALATEVRRPLTSILGVSLALRHSDPDSRDGRELVRQLEASARKLDRMVSVLLELDRLADGTLRLNRRRSDLQALVRRVVEGSPDLASRNIHVEAEKVVVPVDPFIVEQMVETLLSNAGRRTSSDGSLWITVSSDPRAPSSPSPTRAPMFPRSCAKASRTYQKSRRAARAGGGRRPAWPSCKGLRRSTAAGPGLRNVRVVAPRSACSCRT